MNLDKNLFKADYVSEARGILDSLDDIAIQSAKKNRNTAFLKEILRLLHTLKGSSRMMEYSQIEKVINHLETILRISRVIRQKSQVKLFSSYWV